MQQTLRAGNPKTYCSGECKRLAYAGGVRPVYRTPTAKRAVFDRCGWVCGLCDERIDPTIAHPHLRAATIDHVVPLSQGGADDEGNLQAAHFLCNIRKRSPSLSGGGSDARATEGSDRAAALEGALAGA